MLLRSQPIPDIKDFPEPTEEQRKLPEHDIRQLCAAHAEQVYRIVCLQNDAWRESMAAMGWFASWDSAPGFAKLEAENKALAQFGLPPRWNVEREREKRCAGSSLATQI